VHLQSAAPWFCPRRLPAYAPVEGDTLQSPPGITFYIICDCTRCSPNQVNVAGHGDGSPTVSQPALGAELSLSQGTDTRTTDAMTGPFLEPFDGITHASQHAAEAENQYPTGAKFYSILPSLGFLMSFAGLDASIVVTAVPAITDHFHTIADVGWYSIAFRLPLCSFQFLSEKLYKQFPVKNMLVTQGILLVGSPLYATAATSKMFVFGRAVTSLAAAVQALLSPATTHLS
jgi:hypothetical protein